MAKFTKAQRRQIESALSSIERVIKFIEHDKVAICQTYEINHLCSHGPQEFRAAEPHRTQAYKGVEDREWEITYINSLTPINKAGGSDLVSIYTAQSTLRNLMEISS